MAARPFLQALADYAGILPDYLGADGRKQYTADPSRESILAALGFDASSEESAARSLNELRGQDLQRLFPPVSTWRENELDLPRVDVMPPADLEYPLEWLLSLRLEDGQEHRASGSIAPAPDGSKLALTLPVRPAPGYHTVSVILRSSHRQWSEEQLFIVAPRQCTTIREIVDHEKVFGICTNLYSVPSDRNWGVGDLGDLSSLTRWSASCGAAFVGINPLHALRNTGADISPYSPVSRLYRNIVYMDIGSVPELAECPRTQAYIAPEEFRRRIERCRASGNVQYDEIAACKLEAMRRLFEIFRDRHRDRRTNRGAAFAEYRRREGQALTDFATFLALENHLARTGRSGTDWRDWPPALRDPRSADVESFRRKHRDDVSFCCYVQFELDRQLRAVQDQARALGMPVGLYQDLALAPARNGSDVWANPGLFVDGVSLGAPPDDYSSTGQDWGLPAINPRHVATTRYRYWIEAVRRAVAHVGALRIDHVMGLWRQFWIPRRQPATAGAYVRYPADDLLAILALESRRSGTLVIGEDLGTVPPGLSRILEDWGILSTRVLYFQRAADGKFLPPSAYCNRSVVAVTTHDHPPLKSFWEGTDLAIRRQLGLISSDREWNRAITDRDAQRRALLDALAAEDVLFAEEGPPQYPAMCRAVYAFLSRTPAPLLAVMLDDLTGETHPVNIPGIGADRYRSWSRKMRMALDDWMNDPDVAYVLTALSERALTVSRPSAMDGSP